MEKRVTVAEYLRMPETMYPQQLIYGVVREPPAPAYGHQAVVTRIGSMLFEFARRTKLGVACVSPVDVVLDRERNLVVQPDVIFVREERRHIVTDRVWGAPDLVVEVLSPRTAASDRKRKLEWYRKYGVRECWLVDDRAREVTVVRMDAVKPRPVRIFRPPLRIYSPVLPGFRPSVRRLLGAGSARRRRRTIATGSSSGY